MKCHVPISVQDSLCIAFLILAMNVWDEFENERCGSHVLDQNKK